jgi:hypothetical protein
VPEKAIQLTLDRIQLLRQPPEHIVHQAEYLDPWQQEVKRLLDKGLHVIVDAPTTAGKTRAVEVYFAENIHNPGFRACYTCPVKSLANDKMREFRDLYGKEQVGLSTGEIKDNLNAPIVVATLESYRNTLIGVEPDLGRKLVVFDEYHYIQDPSRGSAWEESIILTPQSSQILMLSASVANAESFQEWLQNIKERECELIRVKERPVPLENLVFTGGSWISDQVTHFPKSQPSTQKGEGTFKQALDVARLGAALENALALELTPTIIYAAKRMQCEELAANVCMHLPYLDPTESARLSADIDTLAKQIETSLPADLYRMLTEHGVGFHHSGIAAGTRYLIECLLKEGKLRFCFATMGLSLGINFAVRSTMISDFSRPSETGPMRYPSSEVLQMLGRAGRRGRDRVGFSLWLSPVHYQLMGAAKREDCYSHLRNDPTTYLGLIGKGQSPDDIMNFYASSLRKFQQRKLDLTCITLPRLQKKLNNENLPCLSPAFEFARAQQGMTDSKCHQCHERKHCHMFLRSKTQGDLTKLQLHLAKIGATDQEDKLTRIGEYARYFPQNGGLLVAKYLARDAINRNNLSEGLQLCAALALAGHKRPGSSPAYEFPWDMERTLAELISLYPYDVFPELWDKPRFRNFLQIREWNPSAGFMIKELLRGSPWEELIAQCTNEYFGEGDLLNLTLRVATYLRSIMACSDESLRQDARYLEELFLTAPTFVG